MTNHRRRIERLEASIPDTVAAARSEALNRALKLMTLDELRTVREVLDALQKAAAGFPESEAGERMEACYEALPEELREVYDRAMQRMFDETPQAQDGENVEGVADE